MAYQFDVEGWENWDGARFDGEPPEPEAAHGVFVHVYDTDNPDHQEHFWAYVYDPYLTWEDWYDYIEIMNTQSGLAYSG